MSTPAFNRPMPKAAENRGTLSWSIAGDRAPVEIRCLLPPVAAILMLTRHVPPWDNASPKTSTGPAANAVPCAWAGDSGEQSSFHRGNQGRLPHHRSTLREGLGLIRSSHNVFSGEHGSCPWQDHAHGRRIWNQRNTPDWIRIPIFNHGSTRIGQAFVAMIAAWNFSMLASCCSSVVAPCVFRRSG